MSETTITPCTREMESEAWLIMTTLIAASGERFNLDDPAGLRALVEHAAGVRADFVARWSEEARAAFKRGESAALAEFHRIASAD